MASQPSASDRERAESERKKSDFPMQQGAECRRSFERERALEQRFRFARRASVSRVALPASLRDRLAATAAAANEAAAAGSAAPAAAANEAEVDSRRRQKRLARWAAVAVPALAAALLGLALLLRGSGPAREPLIDEASNDHLRVLYAQHPIESESGGIHRVKPWFAGKVAFAPVLDFSGDEEFPLQGGAIALFVDRKAATFVFKHRLHLERVFVFRSQDLSFPARAPGDRAIGQRSAASAASRGFNVLLWQERDLDYALVSDMDPKSLARDAEKLAAR